MKISGSFVKINFCLLITILLTSLSGFSQSYKSRTFREINGLPSNTTYAMSQLDDGLLFVITNKGVCTFNGFSWYVFPDSLQLPQSHNTRIRKTEDGALYIAGVYNDKLKIVCYKNQRWTFYPVPEFDISLLSKKQLAFDVELKNGSPEMIFSIGSEVFTFSSGLEKWKKITVGGLKPETEINDVRFRNGEIFVLTSDGLWTGNSKAGFKRTGLKTPNNIFVRLENDAAGDGYYLLGNAWLAKVQDGNCIVVIPSFPVAFSDPLMTANLYFSEQGQLFFSLNSNIYYLKSDGKTYQSIITIGQVEAFWHNSVFVDRENNLWISANRGLAMISNLGMLFMNHSHGFPEDEVSGLIELEDGGMLAGSNYSLSYFSGNRVSVLFEADPKDKIIYRFTNFQEHKGEIYFSAFQKGIGKYSPSGGLKWICPLPPGNSSVNSFFFSGDSLFVFSRGLIFLWRDNQFLLIKEMPNYIRRAVVLNDGRIFLLSAGNIFVFRGPEKNKFYFGNNSNLNNTTSLVEVNGRILVGTYDGLAELKGDSIVPFVSNENKISRPVFEIIKDKNGSLWAGTDNGLFVLQKNGEIRHLYRLNGLIGNEINRTTLIQKSDGRMFIGTAEGLAIFDPEEDRPAGVHPIPVIYSATDGRNRVVDLKSDIFLKARENNLEITFGAITMSPGNKINYMYQLEGFDESWKNLVADKRTSLKYINLPGNNYRFKLKIKKGDNLWTETISSSLIYIDQPLYFKWYFILIEVIFSAGLGFLIYQWLNQHKMISQKKQLEEQHEVISKSLRYAERIQSAMLPSPEELNRFLDGYFIFYKPRDIIAGDFYWFLKTENEYFLAVADCTGHGVPGAMVSVICANALHRSITDRSNREPSLILNEVQELIFGVFSNKEKEVTDGMDIALCRYNPSTGQLTFAGAHSNLYRITKKNTDTSEAIADDGKNQVIIYKGDHKSIGRCDKRISYTQQDIPLTKGDQVFLTTDGFADQFSAETGKKFLNKRLLQLMLQLYQTPMENQLKVTETAFESWRGGEKQTDDVCMMGIKFF